MNPYFIPRRDSSRDLMGLAGLGLQLYGLKQRGDIATGQQALTAKELGLRGETLREQKRVHALEYGTPGNLETGVEPTIGLREQQMNIESRRVGALEAQTRLGEQKLNPREKNWGLGDYTIFGSRLRQMGFEPDKLEFMKELKATAMDNTVNRGVFAENLKSSWDQGGKNRFLDDLQKNVDDTLKKNPNADVRKQLALIDTIQKVESKDVIPTFFPDITQHDVMEAKRTMPSYSQAVGGKVVGGEITPEAGAKLIHPPTVKTETLKEQKLKELWPTLSPEEKKKTLDALPTQEKPEKLTMSDVKTGYDMAMNTLKMKTLTMMTPEERVSLEGMDSQSIMAMLLAGNVGKALSLEQKDSLIQEAQNIQAHYSGLETEVMGRKGVKPKIQVPELAPSHKPGGQPTRYEYRDGKLIPK